MIMMALIFLAIAISSAVIGMYASLDQGLEHILYWSAIVNLGVAAGFWFVAMGMRRYND